MTNIINIEDLRRKREEKKLDERVFIDASNMTDDELEIASLISKYVYDLIDHQEIDYHIERDNEI